MYLGGFAIADIKRENSRENSLTHSNCIYDTTTTYQNSRSDMRSVLLLLSFCYLLSVSSSARSGKNGLECTPQGYVLDRTGKLISDKTCCLNRNGDYKIKSTKFKCCSGAKQPFYIEETHLCNVSTVIEREPHLYQCSPNKVCARGLVPGVIHPEIILFPSKTVSEPPSTVRPSSPQQDAESSESCSVFDDDPNCCDGKILTENFLCNPRNFRVRKRHPSHDKVCGDLTFNSGNETCMGDQLLPGTDWCGDKKMTPKSTCCEGNYFTNVTGCCGAKGFGKGQICCGSFVYDKKPGYRCKRNQYRASSVKPLQSYFFKLQRKKKVDGSKVFVGTLIIPSSSLPIKTPRKMIYNFEVSLPPRQKLKKQKWYTIITEDLLSESDSVLTIKNKSDVLKLSSSISRDLSKYLKYLKKHS